MSRPGAGPVGLDAQAITRQGKRLNAKSDLRLTTSYGPEGNSHHEIRVQFGPRPGPARQPQKHTAKAPV